MNPALLCAGSSVLWQIGVFDDSAHEFNLGIDPESGRPTAHPIDYTDPADNPVFVVGKSDPMDWYAYQPATSNGKAGFRAHPFTIQFDLPEKPKGLFTLKLSLLDYTPRLPRLEVNVNGHRGLFYQHPILNYSGGDTANLFIPHYSKATITCDLPTDFLQRGTNKLVLTALDEPGDRDDSIGPTVAVGNSGITYDALALQHDPEKSYSAAGISVYVEPTIFYRSQGSGLTEVVDVFARFNEHPRQARVTLAVGGNKLSQEFKTERDFGEQLVEFAVPEFGSVMKGEATILLNGRSKRFPLQLSPGRKWNIFVVPHEHLDIGYTDYPPKVAEVQSRAIGDAIDMIHEHPDFRFTVDGFWSAGEFMAGRSENEQKEFLRLIQEKKIFVPAQYASYFTGLPNLEYLLRSFYDSYKFDREHGGDFDHANLSDVPSHSWSYPSVMAAAGLKYLMLACNDRYGPILLLGRLHEKSPFWWEGPDGQRTLTWYSRDFHQVASMFGLPPSMAAGHDALPTFLQTYDRPDYKSDATIIFGTQWENQDLYREQAALASEWNALYAFPKLRLSGVAEAMGYIAGQMGDSIPVLRGDGGPYWDRGMAGEPLYTALARQNEHRALTAEKLSTISSLVDWRIWPDREALRELWKDILTYEEHSWDGSGSSGLDPSSPLVNLLSKEGVALDGTRLIEQVLMRSMSAIADSIEDSNGTLVVFNPVNWTRSSLVEFDLRQGTELVDLRTKKAVPYEVLKQREGFRHIRFMASDVPALGYKCFTIAKAKVEPEASSASPEPILENAFYRVVLDPASGAIRSIFDKELNRELVDSSSLYAFDQYVYVTGKESPRNAEGLSTAIFPPLKLETHTPSAGKIVSVSRAPFGTVARLETSTPQTPRIETEIILFEGQKKIEFINRLPKAPSCDEQVYFAFPFAMGQPEFRYEVQNGIVNPAKDMLPGASLEWFIAQHWVAVEQDEVTAAIIPLDVPFVTFGDIIRGAWPRQFGQRKGTIFSYALRNDYGRCGEEDLTFRYVLSSGNKLQPAFLSRSGWEEMSPLETNEIVPNDKVDNPQRPLDSAQGSFLEVDQPNVVLVTWKRAEEGEGTILRFVEVGGQSGTVNVSSPVLKVQNAWLCTSVEEKQRPLEVSPQGFTFPVKPFEIVTVRLEGTPVLK
jgi:hypothetical protein